MQNVTPEDAIEYLYQTARQAPVPADRHDQCRQIADELKRMIIREDEGGEDE